MELKIKLGETENSIVTDGNLYYKDANGNYVEVTSLTISDKKED